MTHDSHRDLLLQLLDRSLPATRIDYHLPDGGRVQGGARDRDADFVFGAGHVQRGVQPHHAIGAAQVAGRACRGLETVALRDGLVERERAAAVHLQRHGRPQRRAGAAVHLQHFRGAGAVGQQRRGQHQPRRTSRGVQQHAHGDAGPEFHPPFFDRQAGQLERQATMRPWNS